MVAAGLLQAHEVQLLSGLRLEPGRVLAGRLRGERLSRRKGISIEFADFRSYAEGDDPRHLDWHVMARSDRAVVKTYRDEEDLILYLLPDLSASMDFGEPTKLEIAKRLAMGLGLVALLGTDAVNLRPLGPLAPNRPMRGRTGVHRLGATLKAIQPQAKAVLASEVRKFASSSNPPGIAVVLSDGLDPEAPNLVRLIGGRGHEVWFIQVLSPLDLDPDLEGDLRLIDSESEAHREITANAPVLDTYRANLQAHVDAIRTEVIKVGGRYALARTDEPFENLLKNTFLRERWLTR